jgi:hypothetical protein
MLEPIVSQTVELAKLDEALAALRIRRIRAAMAGQGKATNSPDSDKETEQIVAKMRAFYRGKEWKARFPAEPDEPDALVKQVMSGSRDLAMSTIVLLHQLIMDAPVVGCDSDVESAR